MVTILAYKYYNTQYLNIHFPQPLVIVVTKLVKLVLAKALEDNHHHSNRISISLNSRCSRLCAVYVNQVGERYVKLDQNY